MKKIVSILIVAVLTLSSLAAFAEPAAKGESLFPSDAGVHLEGYVVGDGANETGAKWVGFSSENPSETELYTFHLSTLGAAYYGGRVYGYCYGYEESGVLHDEFYVIDAATHIASYPEGCSSNGVMVYGMAYDYSANVMYALCDDEHPYLATVDLSNGALTRAVTIDLGSSLGVYGLAIDMEGNIYCITLSALSGKLVKVDKQDGSLTVLANSGMPCYYGQCITYDCVTNRIFWAEVDGPNTASNGLYSFDLSNNYALSYHGVIGTNFELMAMYSTSEPQGANAIPGDVNGDGSVSLDDALLALRASMGLFTLDETQTEAADVNQSGSVTAEDALAILRYAMGLIAELG